MKKAIVSCLLVLGVCIGLGTPVMAQARYLSVQPQPQIQPPNYYPQPQIQPPNYYPQPQIQPPTYYQPYTPMPQSVQPVPPIQPPSPGWPNTGSGYWGGGSMQQMYQCGLQLVYAKRYYEAIRVFDEFLRYYPQSSLADNALYWTGECYYAMKQYRTALQYFQHVICYYPRANKVPDSMLKTALSYFSMNQTNRGCQVLNDLVARYPNSESARKAYRWMNRCGWYYPQYPSSDYGSYTPYYYGDASFPKNY